MAYTKRDLVVRISSETGLVQSEVMQVVQRTLDLIVEALATDKTVELRNFGVFQVITRKSSVGRNPKKPEIEVRIPERRVVKFKPGKIMKQRITDQPQESTVPPSSQDAASG